MSRRGSIYCGHCGRTFGGRYCGHRHFSPPDAIYCVQCGSQELTESTPYLGFDWLSHLVTWGLVIGGVVLIWHVIGPTVELQIRGIINVGMAIAILLMFVPGNSGVQMRRWGGKLVHTACRWCLHAVSLCLRTVWQAVEGSRRDR